MGILTRFKDIMSSNINALLDKAEDPAKMADQYIRNLEKDFGQVKAETASVMATEKSAKRALDECQANIDKYMSYAKKAVNANDDALAKKCLARKNEYAAELPNLQKAYDVAHENSNKMRQMYDKLNDDIQKLRAKKDTIKATAAVAKTQQKMNKMMDKGVGSARSNINAFSSLEERANKMLDQANAEAELISSEDDDLDAQIAALSSDEDSASIDEELAALKGTPNDSDLDAELEALRESQD